MAEPKQKIPVFKVIVLLIGLIGIVVAALSALGPANTEVQRSIFVKANQQDVFEFLLDFQHYHQWQLASDRDSNMTHEIIGPKAEGAKYLWSGNELVGKGQIEITKADPYRLIVMEITFTEPWDALAHYRFNLITENNSTKVTWHYEAKNSFMSRIQLLFMNLDRLLGAELEEGLERMRTYYIDFVEKEKTQ
jgi:uncharacterized protein YndB with AHSA1/START domain